MRQDIVRIIAGFLLFTLNTFLADLVHGQYYLSIIDTFYVNSIVVVLASVYSLIIALVMTFFWKNRVTYSPPFTFFYVMVQVYGMGCVIFVSFYCMYVSNVQSSLMFLAGLFLVHIDDVLYQNLSEKTLMKFLHATIGLIAMIPVFLIRLDLGNDWSYIKMLMQSDVGTIITMEGCPVLVAVLFYFFRMSNYHVKREYMIPEILQYGVPFAFFMSLIIILSFNSCLLQNAEILIGEHMFSISHVNIYSIWALMFLPLTSMMAVVYLFYNTITGNTLDHMVALAQMITCRYVYYKRNGMFTVACMATIACVSVLRLWYSYCHEKATHANKDVNLSDVEEDCNYPKEVPASDDSI